MKKIEYPIYRKDAIKMLCSDKSVLHLGFIQHSHLYEKLIKEDKWLHSQISRVSSKLVGIDYLKEDVDYLKNKYGYDCYFGDVCDLDSLTLNAKFDVIVCGELIEHLENPGLMLDGLKRFMHKETIIIITTPNPWSSTRIRLIKKGSLEKEWLNPEHTCWYSYETLNNLLCRKNYNVCFSGYYVGQSKSYNKQKSKFTSSLFYKGLRSLYRLVKPKRIYMSDGLFFIATVNMDKK